MDPSLLDDIILRLLDVRHQQHCLSESESRQLCVAARDIFLRQPCLLELEAPVNIVGDIHGQYPDLLRLFEYGGYPPTSNYLFLGNYVDFGKQSLETLWLLLAYKIRYPENLFMLRGNHECAKATRIYGFYDECKRRFTVRLWKVFTDCFNCMPVAALVDDKIFCVHGGLSPDLQNLDQIRTIQRPTDVPNSGLLCDLLWSDPSRDVQGWGMNDGGVSYTSSYTFGDDIVSEFLNKNDIDLICRGNQVVEDGYEFFAHRKLATIFSAPDYRGEFDNAAAFMNVDENLVCSFLFIKSQGYSHPRKQISGSLNAKMTEKFEDVDIKKGEVIVSQMDPSLLDDIILRLLDVRHQQHCLSESESRQLCVAARDIFLRQPCLLELEAPVNIVGDIHGQYPDLLRFFEYGGYPPTFNYLFLGNYVDFGKQSLETLWLLLAFKIKYPENLFMLRGNHECARVNRIYGFYDECKRRINVRMWKIFTDCFNCMPVAALVDDKIFCVHGGLSPDLQNLNQIRNIERPNDVPDSGLLYDLLWSDPSRDVYGWKMNDGGVSYSSSFTFGDDKVSEFLNKNDLDLICRGNQVVEDGYEFFADRKLVTIFSAPHYREEFDNAGAILSVDENLVCNFQLILPQGYSHPRKQISGSLNATSSESSSRIKPPPKVVFDPTSLYKSKSRGVKRFLGARV